MVDLAAAEAAREGAVTRTTHEDQARAFRRWRDWCDQIGLIEDYFLDNFTKGQRIRLMGAFAMAMRNARFSGPAHDTLAEGTIRGTISYVASTFRENDRPNPTKDEDGELGRLLSRQYRAYRNEDPNPVRQKCILPRVFKELQKNKLSETKRAIGELAGSAFFFANRSCEYLKVPQSEKRRTDILRLRNVRFFSKGRLLSHDNPRLEYADCVSRTFERQKKDERMDTVTQMATGDATLCPVRLDAALVRRIRKYPGSSDNTPVSAVWRNSRIEHVTSEEMIEALQAAVKAIGEELLGIKAEEVGTHSIRSGSAMAMFLGECPVYTIMMIGRWSSDAFLRYIRKQVQQFSHNVSCRMLRFEMHWHVPEQKILHEDPRLHNHKDNAETRRNVGGNMSRRVKLPAFSLFN